MADLLINGMSIGDIESVMVDTIRFMPYRGPGHYELSTQMREKGRCEGVLVLKEKMKDVIIVKYSEYGVLKYEETQQDVQPDAFGAG